MSDQNKTKEQLIFELVTLRQILHQLTHFDKPQPQNECLPICTDCKKIRDEQGQWQTIEAYLYKHFGLDFSHGFCVDCLAHRHLEIDDYLVALQNH